MPSRSTAARSIPTSRTKNGVTGNWSTHRFRNPAERRFLAVTAHSTRNLVMASVQRCAAQHPGRRAAETVCRQFQCPRLHFSRRHLRQCGFLGGTVYPSAPESGAAKTLSSSQGVCAGLGDCPVSGRQLGTRASLCRPVATSFGSLHRRLRQQTVLRRLNTKHPPGKGPFAVRAAPVLSPWLPSVAPGNRGGGGPGVRFRGARCRRRVLLLLPALPGG